MKNFLFALLLFATLGLTEGLSFANGTRFCTDLKCENAGVCIITPNNISKCICFPFYTGRLCQNRFCLTSPCQNGGTCIQYNNGTFCQCKSPYVGTRCQIKCDIVADIMIAIDESGSINPFRFNKVIDFAISIVQSFDVDNGKTRIGVITFSYNVVFHFDLQAYNNKFDLITMINLLRYTYSGGATNTEKAFRYLDYVSFTPQHGDRKNVPNYVFIITDGMSRYPRETERSAFELKTKGTTIYTFGFGYRVNFAELCRISSSPSSMHVVRRAYYQLTNLMDKFIRHNCKALSRETRCIPCNEDCQCVSGMNCCNGCCKNTVMVEC